MRDPVDALVLDLLEWIGLEGRPYSEVMEAWRTSCPRLPVWERANERGLVERHSDDAGPMIRLSTLGATFLAQRERPVGLPKV